MTTRMAHLWERSRRPAARVLRGCNTETPSHKTSRAVPHHESFSSPPQFWWPTGLKVPDLGPSQTLEPANVDSRTTFEFIWAAGEWQCRPASSSTSCSAAAPQRCPGRAGLCWARVAMAGCLNA